MRENLPSEAAEDLDVWLERSDWTTEQIAGDASVRSYFRVSLPGEGSRVLAFYPQEVRADIERVVRAHDALDGVLPVPRIVRHSARCILQEDAGDQTLTELLSRDREAAIASYHDAVDLLGRLRGARSAAAINPPFDAAKFGAELEMTLEFYVTKLAGVTSDEATGALGEAFTRLADKLTQHNYVLCHRDYHGQNIHVRDGALVVIDYQDLRMGPDTYDLASLVRDRGVWKTIGPAEEARLLGRWGAILGDGGDALAERYLESLLQRSIKAVGTFARMAVVYGRGRYLEYLDPTLETVRDCAVRLGGWPEILEHFPWRYDTN